MSPRSHCQHSPALVSGKKCREPPHMAGKWTMSYLPKTIPWILWFLRLKLCISKFSPARVKVIPAVADSMAVDRRPLPWTRFLSGTWPEWQMQVRPELWQTLPKLLFAILVWEVVAEASVLRDIPQSPHHCVALGLIPACLIQLLWVQIVVKTRENHTWQAWYNPIPGRWRRACKNSCFGHHWSSSRPAYAKWPNSFVRVCLLPKRL